jgi:uncharacterized protein YutE (UPF0331/DUF86 family)
MLNLQHRKWSLVITSPITNLAEYQLLVEQKLLKKKEDTRIKQLSIIRSCFIHQYAKLGLPENMLIW